MNTALGMLLVTASLVAGDQPSTWTRPPWVEWWAKKVAFSPDGKYLAQVGPDTKVVLWELATGKQVRTMWSRPGTRFSLAPSFSADGKLLALANPQGIDLFDVASGKWKKTQHQTTEVCYPYQLHFSPTDPNVLVVVVYPPDLSDQFFKCWDLAKGKVHTQSLEGKIEDLCFSYDGRYIGVAISRNVRSSGKPGEALIYDVKTGRKMVLREGIQGDVLTVAFSPDSKKVLTGGGVGDGRPGELITWDLGTGKGKAAPNQPTRINRVRYSRNGKYLAMWGWSKEGGLVVRDPDNRIVFSLHKGGDIEFAPDNRLLCRGKLWNLHVQRQPVRTLAGKGRASLSADGKTVAVDGNLYAVQTGRSVGKITKGIPAFSPKGNMMAVGHGRQVALYLEDGKRFLGNVKLTYVIEAVTFSPDGSQVALRVGQYVELHSTRKLQSLIGKRLRNPSYRYARHSWFSRGTGPLAFSRDGKYLAASSVYNPSTGVSDPQSGFGLWDVDTGQAIRLHLGRRPPFSASSVAFLPDSKRVALGSGSELVSGGADVLLWETRTGKPAGDLQGSSVLSLGGIDRANQLSQITKATPSHPLEIAVTALACSPDGRYLASGGKTIKVWNLKTGCEELLLVPGAKPVASLAFTSDGNTLISGGDAVRVWDVSALRAQPRVVPPLRRTLGTRIGAATGKPSGAPTGTPTRKPPSTPTGNPIGPGPEGRTVNPLREQQSQLGIAKPDTGGRSVSGKKSSSETGNIVLWILVGSGVVFLFGAGLVGVVVFVWMRMQKV